MSGATGIDHLGIVTADLPASATEFERLGFQLTQLAHHASGRTGNRCVMLRHSYLELMAVMPGCSSATLDGFLTRHAGAHILGLTVDDPAAQAARLQRAGFGAIRPAETERGLDAADRSGPRARFCVLTPPSQPEGLVLLLKQLTPELLWQERWLLHPNGVVTLAELIVAATEPAETAARLSRLAGRSVLPDPLGGYALDLPRGRVRVLPATVTAELFPGVSLPPAPCFAGLTLHTFDGNAALLALWRDRGIPHQQTGGAVVTAAGGIGLRVQPGQ